MSPRNKALIAACAIFMLGLGLGTLGTTLVGIRITRKALSNQEGFGLVQRGLERFRGDLVGELKPTEAQLVEIDRELAALSAEVRETRRRFARDLLLDLRDGSQGIRRCLDEERRARFDALLGKRLRNYGLRMPGDEAGEQGKAVKPGK